MDKPRLQHLFQCDIKLARQPTDKEHGMIGALFSFAVRGAFKGLLLSLR